MRAKRKKVRVGDKYGRLEVVSLISSISGTGIPRTMAECLCSCGNKKTIRSDGLSSGGTKSCGCLDTETKRKRFIQRNKELAKFGSFSTKYPKTFASWRSMNNRCYNNNQKTYVEYGSKGVKVCKFIRESPEHLVELIGLRKKRKPSLDRFPKHDGHYSCGLCIECKQNGWEFNIRWCTRREQSENRGGFNIYLTAFGKTQLLSHWEKESGIDARRIMVRIRREKWSVEKALTTPDKKGHCYVPQLT